MNLSDENFSSVPLRIRLATLAIPTCGTAAYLST
jgi:hypothetical protein